MLTTRKIFSWNYSSIIHINEMIAVDLIRTDPQISVSLGETGKTIKPLRESVGGELKKKCQNGKPNPTNHYLINKCRTWIYLSPAVSYQTTIGPPWLSIKSAIDYARNGQF